MAARSAITHNLDMITKQINQALLQHGFRRRGRTFLHEAEPGLFQVLHLQAGITRLHGQFTINAGIYVEEVTKLLMDLPADAKIVESMCQIRQRIGQLMPDGKDHWWPADSGLAQEIAHVVCTYGLPFLQRYGSRQAILQHGDKIYSQHGWTRATHLLSSSIMRAQRGEPEIARALLQTLYDDALQENPQLAARVRLIAGQLNLDLELN